jgi:hypothetical protein
MSYNLLGENMTKKEEFKLFVKNNPKLLKYTKTGEMTWQKFYEIYDIYGDKKEAWNEYLKEEEVKEEKTASAGDFISWIKKLDLDSVKEGVSSLQKVIGVVKDLGVTEPKKEEVYKPRPIYKKFED